MPVIVTVVFYIISVIIIMILYAETFNFDNLVNKFLCSVLTVLHFPFKMSKHTLVDKKNMQSSGPN